MPLSCHANQFLPRMKHGLNTDPDDRNEVLIRVQSVFHLWQKTLFFDACLRVAIVTGYATSVAI